MENLVNDFTTALNGAIDDSTTTVVVDTNSSVSANFRVRVDDELMLVTANGSTTWTVTRGVEGTTAVSHLDDAPVNAVVTAAGFAQWATDRYWALSTDLATQAELDAHTGDTSDAHDASAISIADAGGYTAATDAEALLQEVAAASTRPMTPQGRLTLATATPVMTSDQANQTTVYYTPYAGSTVPLYDGTYWKNTAFSELSIAMAASANWAVSSNFDLYVYNDAGTLRLVTGAAWTNATTRSESLTMLNGILTNNASMTGRYGAASTVTVAANRGTYVGTMRTTASTGTTTWVANPASSSGGTECKLFLWNAYNRVSVHARSLDSTNSWTYATNTWRSINASDGNRVSVVIGLVEDSVEANYRTWSDNGSTASAVSPGIGVGYDVTNNPSGYANLMYVDTSNISLIVLPLSATLLHVPTLGYHFYQALEVARLSNTITNYGDNNSPTEWENGIDLKGRF